MPDWLTNFYVEVIYKIKQKIAKLRKIKLPRMQQKKKLFQLEIIINII